VNALLLGAKLAALALLCCFLFEAALLVSDVRSYVPRLALQSSGLIQDADATLKGIDIDVEHINDAAQKEAAYYDPARPGGLPQQIQRTAVDLKRLIGRTDLSLNGRTGSDGLFAHGSQLLESVGQDERRITDGLVKTTARPSEPCDRE
jgi:hypothetical protein